MRLVLFVTLLWLSTPLARAHPGHEHVGGEVVHHGTELLILAACIAALLVLARVARRSWDRR
ncbi:MAG: hypothetical protein O2894_00785 [Planctomycetota bacterium]|nr:hypothetical protein [Planctomycetota bacterium]